jgi:16S rRNA (guanine966-N2)-methyltransferase
LIGDRKRSRRRISLELAGFPGTGYLSRNRDSLLRQERLFDVRIIAGQAHGRKLKAPRGLNTRPATARARASIFSRLLVRLDFEGLRVLDIFAGSGSLGIEALSRGAEHVTFIDSSRAATAVIRENLKSLGFAERGRVMTADLHRALPELCAHGEAFGLAFIDAPYANDISAEVLASLVQLGLISAGGWIVVRQSRRAPEPPPPPVGLEQLTIATLGDHRIAYYRRPVGAEEKADG